ncbi:MAG: hypothetical protein CL476_10645 [Acidobacteria bacterium]|jgi:hypothetical protein|nr:hypothetical protein [Acidobacteriota bacterium]MDP7338832.1 hypothetical protein [Vicinamibacterales bacterium]|tara:strand:- start:1068 stop:1412 length:345 start_codon:yes stop_codon:yes gene_type:complete
MTRQELNAIVRGVVRQFERDTGRSLTARGLDAIVTPAVSHLDTIRRELDERTMTVPFLEGAVRTVLVNAGAIADERGESAISFYTVRESLKKECPHSCWSADDPAASPGTADQP